MFEYLICRLSLYHKVKDFILKNNHLFNLVSKIMYLVSSAIYSEVAQRLREDIDNDSFYSGVVEFSLSQSDDSDIECRLVCSLIIYYSTSSPPEGDVRLISNIVPVWVEFHTIINSEEKINDFDIEELKTYMCLCC